MGRETAGRDSQHPVRAPAAASAHHDQVCNQKAVEITSLWPLRTLCLRRILPTKLRTQNTLHKAFNAIAKEIINRREGCRLTCLVIRGFRLMRPPRMSWSGSPLSSCLTQCWPMVTP
ncbi:hypothetical protein ACOMHN_033892 [Nucella lapillus]